MQRYHLNLTLFGLFSVTTPHISVAQTEPQFTSSEYVANFPPDSTMARLARPIVFLQFDFEERGAQVSIPCTGAILGGRDGSGVEMRYVATAMHCIKPGTPEGKLVRAWAVPSQQPRKDQFVQFRLSTRPSLISPCDEEDFRGCEDIALLEFESGQEGLQDLPTFPLFFRAPRHGERIQLLHHPGKSSLVVTRQDCWITKIRDDSSFLNNCETDGGSSGALVLAEDDGALLGVHHGKFWQDRRFNIATTATQFERHEHLREIQRVGALDGIGVFVEAASAIPDEMRGNIPIFPQLVNRACLIANVMMDRGSRYSPAPLVIFFDWDNADITPEAYDGLLQYAGALIEQDRALEKIFGSRYQYYVKGHSDREFGDEYGFRIAQRRAQVVADFLVARGVASGRITTESLGTSRPLVPIENGVRELLNRRVELTVEAQIDPESDIGRYCATEEQRVFYLFEESIDTVERSSLTGD